MRRRSQVPLAISALVLAACGSSAGEIDPSGVDELVVPTPTPDPRDFVDGVDNPWFPLAPGSRWVYRITGEDGEQAREVVTVTEETRVVAGVTTTVVHDVVRDADGRLLEETWDWFAQDRAGNVWYFGEDTTAYDEKVPSTEGSWEAGVDGAQAGLVMAAVPRVGDGYAQEHLAGVAEDRARVVSLETSITTAAGTYDQALETEDTTPLEPDLVERKTYARGVGLVSEREVAGGSDVGELVSFTPGG